MADIKLLAKELMGLTVEEVLDLKKELKETYGLEESLPQTISVPVETKEEAVKTVFDVIIEEIGGQKMSVIKAWKQLSGQNISLMQSKEIIESAPATLKEKVSKDEAESIKAELEALGAKIVIR